ncbi:MAG TPA: TolC family protein [Tepidisphaeraceae bacterium]|nr:TolC family protein [Tepidisphaeraceae bacterium]
MMRKRKTSVLVLGLAIAGCNAAEPPPFRPRALQSDERARSSEFSPAAMPPLPTTFVSPLDAPPEQQAQPATGNRTTRAATRPTTGPTTRDSGGIAGPSTAPVVELTTPELFAETERIGLKEVIQRTIAYSLDVKIASFDPAVEATRVIEADARFDPALFANLQYQDSKILTPAQGLQTGNPFDPTISRVTQGQTGIRQILTSGGQVELRTGIQRISRNVQFGVNPYYLNDITFQVTQPLLRDAGFTVNQARIVIARNAQRVSLLEFRKAIEDNLELAERTYWQLVQAERELLIAERLYNETLSTVDLLRKRIGQDVSRVQVSQAFASAESRSAALLRARQQVQNLSDQLKRVMNDPDMPVSSGTTLLPASDPVELPVSFVLEDQIKTALDFRLELGQQQLRIDSASIAASVAKNNLLPSLNLQGTYGLQGIGEDIDGAYSTLGDQEYNTWSLGFVFEIPIGNRAARAIHQRALLQRQQAIESYRSLIEQVALDVKQQLRDVEVSYNEIAATRRARFAAADNLAALQQREDNQEPLTPEFVNLKLDAQARLAETARAEAASISNYNTAIARLEKAKGTLLRYNNVEMEQEPRPFGSRPR